VTASAVQATGAAVHRSRLDVSDREAMLAWAAEVTQQFGVVHQIHNNAGVADAGAIEEFGYGAYRRVLDINLGGIHGTKAFRPHLIASGDGHVVNVSSLNGIMAQAEHPVRTTVVHPRGCEDEHRRRRAGHRRRRRGRPVTDAERSRAHIYNEKLLTVDAGRAAEIIVDAVERDRSRVLVAPYMRRMLRTSRTA